MQLRNEQRKTQIQSKEIENFILAMSKKDVEAVRAVHEAKTETRKELEGSYEELKYQLQSEQDRSAWQAEELETLTVELREAQHVYWLLMQDIQPLKAKARCLEEQKQRAEKSSQNTTRHFFWDAFLGNSWLCCQRSAEKW